jgi:ribonuclease HI
MKALEKVIGSNKVTLVCIPGHHGIPRNEKADQLAKEGTNVVPSDQTVGIPLLCVNKST